MLLAAEPIPLLENADAGPGLPKDVLCIIRARKVPAELVPRVSALTSGQQQTEPLSLVILPFLNPAGLPIRNSKGGVGETDVYKYAKGECQSLLSDA